MLYISERFSTFLCLLGTENYKNLVGVLSLLFWNGHYSQNHVKCSRPLCSLPGLQGQKNFADAIINILIPTKSIIEKNCYDQLFINEVVKIFTFHFDESVIKFLFSKSFSDFDEILVSCAQIS